MLARTPTISRADALRERDFRHSEFAEVLTDPHDCMLSDRQRAVFERWLRGGHRYLGAGRVLTPVDGPAEFDHVADRDMDDDGPEFEMEDFE